MHRYNILSSQGESYRKFPGTAMKTLHRQSLESVVALDTESSDILIIDDIDPLTPVGAAKGQTMKLGPGFRDNTNSKE